MNPGSQVDAIAAHMLAVYGCYREDRVIEAYRVDVRLAVSEQVATQALRECSRHGG